MNAAQHSPAKNLVIVQNKPTQFDVPLYAFLEQQASFDLSVYYTQTWMDKEKSVDPETGHVPDWDHNESCRYRRYDFSASDVNDTDRAVEQIYSHRPGLVILSGYSPIFHA